MSTDTTDERPLVGIDDEVRPMTDDEHKAWLAVNLGESALIGDDK